MVKVKASVHAKWQLSDKINKKAASVSHKHTHTHTRGQCKNLDCVMSS